MNISPKARTEVSRGRKNLKYIWRLPGGPLFLAICLLLTLGIVYAILAACGIDLYSRLGLTRLRCGFRSVTGIYCPGCGGTRSLIRLLHFDIIGSVKLHPVPIYVLALTINFFVRFIFAYLVPDNCPLRLKPAVPRYIYLYILCGLVIVNWLVRVILLLCGIPTL